MINGGIMILITAIFLYTIVGFLIANGIFGINDPATIAFTVVFWPFAFFVYLVSIIVDLMIFLLKKEWK